MNDKYDIYAQEISLDYSPDYQTVFINPYTIGNFFIKFESCGSPFRSVMYNPLGHHVSYFKIRNFIL